jgi:hypothetical protein
MMTDAGKGRMARRPGEKMVDKLGEVERVYRTLLHGTR